MHGVIGYLGWAAAPAFMVIVANLTDWRTAFLSAAILEVIVLLILFWNKDYLYDDVKERHAQSKATTEASNPGGVTASTFAFLKLPAVWLCWTFFFFSMAATSGMQSFSPSALFKIYELPVATGSYFLTLMSLGSAGGVLLGGYIASRIKASEKVVSICLSIGMAMTLLMASGWLPMDFIAILFVLLGTGLGVAAPSRDLMIRSATPIGASGRVYGIVYSGIDLGAAIGPLIFGIFMDANLPKLLFIGVALFQLMIILTALRVAKQTRTA